MMARNAGGRPPARGGFGGGPGGFGGMLPPQKTKDLGKTLRQLLARLRPERMRITISAVLALGSVAGTVIGPKIIGNATNVIFDGVIGKSLPAGITKQQAIAGLRAQGHGQIADLVSGANVVPGRGIDFTQLGQILALAALVYLLASGLTWLLSYIMAGVAQRTVYGLRRDAEAKLARLPLKYFDSHPHGDLLSRVTNDIDNITTTLQQGMSQFITSTLTIVGVLAVMVWISRRSTARWSRCTPDTRWYRSSADARRRSRSSISRISRSTRPAFGRSSYPASSCRRWPSSAMSTTWSSRRSVGTGWQPERSHWATCRRSSSTRASSRCRLRSSPAS